MIKDNKIMRKRVSVNAGSPDFTGTGTFNFQLHSGSVKLSLEKTKAQNNNNNTNLSKSKLFPVESVLSNIFVHDAR